MVGEKHCGTVHGSAQNVMSDSHMADATVRGSLVLGVQRKCGGFVLSVACAQQVCA